MGKSKRRNLHKTNSSLFMTRESALCEVFDLLNKNKFETRQKARDLITLFGLEAEELTEAGVDYENVKSFDPLINHLL